MKKMTLGVAMLLSCGAWPLFAADPPSLEERCRSIAQQHGLPAEEIDAWVEKCLDHTKAMMSRPRPNEQNQPHEDKPDQAQQEKKRDSHAHE